MDVLMLMPVMMRMVIMVMPMMVVMVVIEPMITVGNELN